MAGVVFTSLQVQVSDRRIAAWRLRLEHISEAAH